MYGKSGSTEKLKIQNFVNSAGIVYIIYVQNIRICREIEYLEIYKFNGKLCTIMYGMSGFVEKLKIQNFITSARIVYIIFGRNVKICREIENLELRKFNGKLCTLNVRTVQICR